MLLAGGTHSFRGGADSGVTMDPPDLFANGCLSAQIKSAKERVLFIVKICTSTVRAWVH